jgi:glyoxylase-like metal-dependent hydrolase (beta-lactamase superfamily II)
MLTYPFEGEEPEPGGLREVAPGVLWLRMPLPMALDHINIYLLEDDDGWWIVDTGIAIGPTESLWNALFESGELGGKPVNAVLSTHFHPDHTGMAGWLCERWQAPFYMSQAEYLTGLAFSRITRDHFSWNSERHYRRCGYTPEQIEGVKKNYTGFGPYVKPLPTAYRRLAEGQVLAIGAHRWRVVIGRGHSPEHACLYCGALNVLISGDQVIPRITSNVSVTGSEPEANPLRDWINSHEHFLDALPGDALVLPSHNTPFRGLHHRLRHLIEHHEEHLVALEEACVGEAQTALELLPVLFGRELDEGQVGLAVGECVAHLNYLVQRGQLERSEDGEGRYRYRSVDETLELRQRKRRHVADSEPPFQV